MNASKFDQMNCVTRFLTVALGCTASCLAPSPAAVGDNDARQTVKYHGLRPTDPHGREGLRNPERGFRIETLVAELPGAPAWGPAHHLQGKVSPEYSDQWWLLDAQRYAEHGLTLAQTYCYLDAFVGQPISEQKLALLQESLDRLRENGLKAVLRFAYERDMDRKGGPSLPDVLHHLDQLAPLIRQNVDVIFVMQAGFVGAWGEWHSSTHQLESDHAALAAITAKVLEVLPTDHATQVRVPKYKRWALSEPVLGGFQEVTAQTAHTDAPTARIGFHNDGFLAGPSDGGTWPEAPHFGNPGNPEFDTMTHESPYVPVDGELFWSDIGGKIEGLRAAVRLRLHHYSSLSLAHSFSEREGKPYSIDDWMQTPLTVEQVREAKLPLSDGYFADEAGNPVPRTQFEYIRDHLGYRLELQQATFPREVPVGGELTVEVALINRGFSTFHNPRPVCFVLIGEKGVVEFPVPDADPRQWQPYQPGDEEFKPLLHQFGRNPKSEIRNPSRLPDDLQPGLYRLGLWLPDAALSLRLDARYAVRVANRDAPWWTDAEGKYGVNVLGEVRITP